MAATHPEACGLFRALLTSSAHLVRPMGPRPPRRPVHEVPWVGWQGLTFYLWSIQMLISEELLFSVLVDFELETLVLRNSVVAQTGKCKVKCSSREPQDGL